WRWWKHLALVGLAVEGKSRCWTMILKDQYGGTWWPRQPWNFLFLSVTLVVLQVDVGSSKNPHYSWKTGPWGRCKGDECGSSGVQSRSVWCVHSDGWNTHHANCLHFIRPETQRPCFKVCEWHQDLFEWDVSEWSSCSLTITSNELRTRTLAPECITAQHGVQRRSVRCVRVLNGTAVSERICEFFSPRPALEQACLIPCPLDCVVSDFSPWSRCSRTCGVGLKHRTRHVLAAPAYGGADCPGLSETQPCEHSLSCPLGENGHQYSLKVGDWSRCRLPLEKEAWMNEKMMLDFNFQERNVVKRDVQSGQHQHHQEHQQLHEHQEAFKILNVKIGYQTRQVHCMASDGRNVILSLCGQGDSPPTSRSCVMPKDCQTSDWSSWSPCSKTCQSSDLSPGYRFRSRTIILPAVGEGTECPALEEKEACNIIGDLLSKCPRYEWRTTDWSECRVTPLFSPHERRRVNISSLCGGGIQTRGTYCIQVHRHGSSQNGQDVSRPVSSGLCDDGDVPPSVRPCFLPCSGSCLLSTWSSWGPCLPEDCTDPQQRKGYRERRRNVLEEGSGSWRYCEHLVEFMSCEDPVCFTWWIQDEGVCVPREGTCGPGSRTQTVACINSKGERVDSELCEESPPSVQETCEVFCPGDCVISSWSDWSSCPQSCTKKNTESRQSRSRTVLALPGEGGKPCPSAPALEEWRSCTHNPCVVYFWEASPWGPCVSDSSVFLNRSDHSNETSDCAAGLRTRKITCMRISGGSVSEKWCPEWSRLDSVQQCSLPCRRDCVVTLFSEWTTCPTACLPANTTTPTQSRYRTIVQRSTNRGQECPDTLFEERECEALPVCTVYRWKTHRWQGCTLGPNAVQQGSMETGESCGKGLEKRALSCVNENDELVVVSECIQWTGPMPPQVQSCWVPCKDDCTFSTWSKFTECSGCGSTRTHRRSLTGRSRKWERCLKEEVYPLVESEPCVCDELISEPRGNWSVCILPDTPPPLSPHGWRGEKKTRDCGEGKRYRAVACLDQRGRLIDPRDCSESELQEELCSVPCPLDCRLSSWSSWSPCSSSCGSGLKVRSKWLKEKPFNGGRPCPKLDLKNQAQVSEAVPCRGVCGVYQWVAESWSFCSINTVDKQTACGEGVQSRKIRCVLRGDGMNEARTVNDSLCDQDEVPSQARTCVLPCPEDCVMSPWSHWISCPESCDGDSVRTRTRQMLRPSAVHVTCPERNETEPCVINTNCFTYHYNISGWSSCMLSEAAVCGNGTRTRLVDCVRSDGKLVELSVCEKLGLSQPWNLSKICHVNCPVSCILSEWTAWTECSHSCGNQGVMTRSRRVLQEAGEEGRPCPSQLSQTKPCPIRPCYSWLLGEWTPCYVEGAECGDGLRQRNLSCVVHWGHWPESSGPNPISPGPVIAVEEEKCTNGFSSEKDQELQQPCFIPCPGDCHLTEWSSWSLCQLTCVEGRSFEVEGHQARSRAVIIQTLENQESCPNQEIETRLCKGGKCHSYEWKTSTWSNNEREVWCQRSDGVNVTGGCFVVNKPSTVRHCHPPCTKPFSHCKQSGVCGCEKGYTEVMNTHGFLDYCTRNPGGAGDTRKADVKSSSGRVKPGPSQIHDFFGEWSLQVISPDGRIKMWVYGATAGGFILLLFIIAVSFLFCRPVEQSKNSPPLQKALSLAYDGDVDM
ncbi:thrombospondin type-1 domain-containing protein 7B, partial [Trichomycterus rosablanca]|uniref:thrombospondin type-1 domain-containing protein 7B n=1 Tax=Trichomycterus rosablanca TaxID=2290929 RepID=UPI002F359567